MEKIIKSLILLLAIILIFNEQAKAYDKNLPEDAKKYIECNIKDIVTEHPTKHTDGIRFLHPKGWYVKQFERDTLLAFFKKVANNWEAFKQGKLEIISSNDKSLENVKKEILKEYDETPRLHDHISKKDYAKRKFKREYERIKLHLHDQATRIRFYFLGEKELPNDEVIHVVRVQPEEPFNTVVINGVAFAPYYEKEMYDMLLSGYKNYLMAVFRVIHKYGTWEALAKDVRDSVNISVANLFFAIRGNKDLAKLLTAEEIQIIKEVYDDIPHDLDKLNELRKAITENLNDPKSYIFDWHKKTQVKDLQEQRKKSYLKHINSKKLEKRYKTTSEWTTDAMKLIKETH